MNAFFIPLNGGFNFAKIRGFKVTDYNTAEGRWRTFNSILTGLHRKILDEAILGEVASGEGIKV